MKDYTMNVSEETQIEPAESLRAIIKSFYPEAELDELDPTALLNPESLESLFHHLESIVANQRVTGK